MNCSSGWHSALDPQSKSYALQLADSWVCNIDALRPARGTFVPLPRVQGQGAPHPTLLVDLKLPCCGQVKQEEEGSQREAATSCVGLPAMRLGKVVATLSAPLRCFLACLPLGAMPLSAAAGASAGGLPLASFCDAGGGTSLQPKSLASRGAQSV